MFPTTNVLEYLERSAAAHPEKIAAADGVLRCTYEELLRDARRIGSGLCTRFSPRMPVAVFMEKSVETLKLFFGAVYAGCFYVLINPEFPAPRVEAILETLETRRVVTCRSLTEKLPPVEGLEVLYLEDLMDTEENGDALAAIRAQALDIDPLYANFTSGSTGVPKGVAVCHRSVIDFIGHFTQLFSITGEDVIGNQAPFDFDVAVKDIYSAISTGARLEIIPKALFSQPAKLLDHLCDRKVTTMVWAVSALCLVTTFHGLDYKVPETVNKVLFSGEAMPMKHLKQWMSHLPEAKFVNLYGPTEITCNCTYHEVDRNREYSDGLPIGRCFPNEQVFLLDDEDRLFALDTRDGVPSGRGFYALLAQEKAAARRMRKARQQLEAGQDPGGVELLAVLRVTLRRRGRTVRCSVRYSNGGTGEQSFFLPDRMDGAEELLNILDRKRRGEGPEVRTSRWPAVTAVSGLVLAVFILLCVFSHPAVGQLPEGIYFPSLGGGFIAFCVLVYALLKHRRGE